MVGVIVVQSRSKGGGPCKDCWKRIEPGGLVFKISEQGKTTTKGNGPGRWVCVDCSKAYEWDAAVR